MKGLAEEKQRLHKKKNPLEGEQAQVSDVIKEV